MKIVNFADGFSSPTAPSITSYLPIGTAIPSGVDLNTYQTSGFYHQSSNTQAGAGTNYPTGLAGMLEVFNMGLMTYQRYHTYLNGGIYWRVRYNSTWSSWKKTTTDDQISGFQAGIDSKEPTITAGSTTQYWRGDKSWQTLNKAAVGLSAVDNTSDATKNSATATLTNKSLVDSTTFIIDETDATKKVQFQVSGLTTGTTRTLTIPDSSMTLVGRTDTATLTNKTLTAPHITAPTGIVKGDVALGNVDNTSDADKPISTATQTALNDKVTGPASSAVSQIARFLDTTGKVVTGGTGSITSAGDMSLRNVSSTGAFFLTTETASTITGSNAIIARSSTSSHYRLTDPGLVSIGGFNGAGNGHVVIIENVAVGDVTIVNNDATVASAANRFHTGTGANMTLGAGALVLVKYVAGLARWAVVGGSGTAGVTNAPMYAQYTSTAGTVYNNGPNTYIFGTQVSDALGTVSASVFTAPWNGVFYFSPTIDIGGGAAAAGTYMRLYARKNASGVTMVGGATSAGTTTRFYISGSIGYNLNAGDTIDFRLYTNTGGSQTESTSAGQNTLTITGWKT